MALSPAQVTDTGTSTRLGADHIVLLLFFVAHIFWLFIDAASTWSRPSTAAPPVTLAVFFVIFITHDDTQLITRGLHLAHILTARSTHIFRSQHDGFSLFIDRFGTHILVCLLSDT